MRERWNDPEEVIAKKINVNHTAKLKKALSRLDDARYSAASVWADPRVDPITFQSAVLEVKYILSNFGVPVSKHPGCMLSLIPPIVSNETRDPVYGATALLECSTAGWFIVSLSSRVCSKHNKKSEHKSYRWRLQLSPAAREAWSGCFTWEGETY